jgi:oxygen-independent coproporphyrinogen-3 oxidase
LGFFSTHCCGKIEIEVLSMIKGIYIHIPFCEQICVYCDFHKEIATDHKKRQYINRLIQSIDELQNDLSEVTTIYIGGGTPSHLNISLLEQLLKKIKHTVDLSSITEYTIEANPNDITKQKAMLFHSYGINRVSLGVQSFDEQILQSMNRSHVAEDIETAVHNLQNAGITNISIDLIFGFNNQTLDQVVYDLDKAISLDINHISYYALILEEKSIMYHLVKQGKMRIVDEDLDYLMYNKIIDTLIKHGYDHYEVSNFAKPGYYSKHNMLYWTQKSYLGLGSGSHSYVDQKRYNIAPNVSRYIASPNDQECVESYPSYELEDALIFGLRVLKGIEIAVLEDQFQISLFQRYPVLQQYLDKGFLAIDKGFIHLTKKGLMLSNNLFSALLEDHHA